LEGTQSLIFLEGMKRLRRFNKMAKSEKDKIRTVKLYDGTKCEGKLLFGEIDGYDIFISSDGFKYEGRFKDGLFHGDGKATFKDGLILICKWRTGQPIGDYVIMIKMDTYGNTYVGQIDSKNLKYEGYGTCTSNSGSEIISGIWKYSNPVKVTWVVGKRRYDGEVGRNWHWHGRGVYVSEEGDTYEGYFKNGTVDGTKTCADGTIESGQWKIREYVGGEYSD
jgi:hypothetical protein